MNTEIVSKNRKNKEQKPQTPQYEGQNADMTIEKQKKELAIRDSLLKELCLEYEKMKIRVKELEVMLAKTTNSDSYQSANTWISKIAFVLSHENRPLRSADLIRLLELREPQLANHHNKVQYFSAFLTQAVKYNRVIAHKLKGVRGYYYLLPEWMDDKNQPRNEYRKMMV